LLSHLPPAESLDPRRQQRPGTMHERAVMTLVNTDMTETQANSTRQKVDAEMKLSVEKSKRGNGRQGASLQLAGAGPSPQG
jgi:hypothetical protein